MSVIQTLRDFVELSTKSFDNASGTMERVHQKSADMSIDLLKELGFPDAVADDYRQFHHRMVTSSYGRVRTATQRFGIQIVTAAERHAPSWLP